jgi:hypothetical protein
MRLFKNVFSDSDNLIFTTIQKSIKEYVDANQNGNCDFHLIKDIVDRNCDAKEDEIQTQIPIPLYLGLVGTMFGILFGVGYLWISGGLSKLLGDSTIGDGAKGVEALLGGVALAMIASVCGIILSTLGSFSFKKAKSTLEANKHSFLSQIQIDPNIPSGLSSSLIKMTNNLVSFNHSFAENTRELKVTLSTVKDTNNNFAQILTEIDKMKIADIASANIEVYDKLKNCTDEIGKLGEYLHGINQYQTNTTEVITELRKFLSNGNVQIDSINGKVREALEAFGTDTGKYLADLRVKLDSQIGEVNTAVQTQQADIITVFEQQKDELALQFATFGSEMEKVAKEQQVVFKQKMQETSVLVDELKNLTAVKNSMAELVGQTYSQSQQILKLTKAIEKLAETKAGGNSVKFSTSTRIVAYAVGCSVGLAGLLVIIREVISLIKL